MQSNLSFPKRENYQSKFNFPDKTWSGRKWNWVLLLLGLFLPDLGLAASPAAADSLKNTPPKKEVRIYQTERLTTPKPVIDGILDDTCWKTGIWAGDFTQFIPTEGGKPSQPTFVKILYDDKNI